MVQAHIFFTGIVQGIGFRYTVARYAIDRKLVGWVKNLSDGRVEALIEGPKETVNELCESVQSHFKNNLTDVQIDFIDAEGHFKDFQITF